MIEFVNPTGRMVVLTGPNKEQVRLGRFERKILSDWYKRYVPRYLKIIKEFKGNGPKSVPVKKPIVSPSPVPRNQEQVRALAVAQERLKRTQAQEARRAQLAAARAARAQTIKKPTVARINVRKRIVGSTNMRGNQATLHYEELLKKLSYPISNDIGIGILSYNRLDSLVRLLSSIRRHTDLERTTVIISDESDKQSVRAYLRNVKDMAVLLNSQRLGIAGNTNRLLRCLSRFNYKIILNDDVEILRNGWETAYANAMVGTGIHHFCMRQPGVYGAKDDDEKRRDYNGFKVRTILQKPQGAVIAFDQVAFEKVGYFDEQFGVYGMEHVDWSNRVSLSKIQPIGFHDIEGSEAFFKVHGTKSAVEKRTTHLGMARKKFEQLKADRGRIYVKPSEKSEVAGVTYIVPFQGLERSNAIRLVLQNIKAQRYPFIEIIMVEQDQDSRFGSFVHFRSVRYAYARGLKNQPFTKAVAFNCGVSLATQDKLILHDADMVVHADYTTVMANLLNQYDGVHIGQNVLYMSRDSTDKAASLQRFTAGYSVDRTVGYFEGGSLGCRYNTYLNIGGFDERFVGYGCFCPGNQVLTMGGYKPIEDVEQDNVVLTRSNKYKKVTKCFSRYYEGNIYDLWVGGRLAIKGITPEHPFYINGEKTEVSKLKVGDKLDLNTAYFGISTDLDELHNMAYDGEFTWLLGLYLAEGVLNYRHGVLTDTVFCLHSSERFLLDRIRPIVERIDKSAKIYETYRKNAKVLIISVFSKKLAQVINLCAPKKSARNKVLNPFYLDGLDRQQLIDLISGLLDGDGNKQNNAKSRLVFTSSSFNLVQVVSNIMWNLGMPHSVGCRKGSGFMPDNLYYDIAINRSNESLLNMSYKLKPPATRRAVANRFGKITKIKVREYSGFVHNLEVHDDHSYVINGINVANCEDTEFFARLVGAGEFFNRRSVDLIHLWHGRTTGWKHLHNKNKILEKQIYSLDINQRIREQRRRFQEKYKLKSH